jgi:quinol monooxygenase YgiN
MHIIHVNIRVLPDRLDAFRTATLDNARNSALEPGVLRFDALQSKDDPTRFVLVEIYRTPEDQTKHRETAHYLRWRDAVADMMAEPRQAERFDGVIFSDLNTDFAR